MRAPLVRAWTAGDLATLEHLLTKGAPVPKIARRLRRSQSAVRGKLQNLHLHVSSYGDRSPAKIRSRLRRGPRSHSS